MPPAGPERTTAAYLAAARGFSPAMVDRLFRPFLGGVFLDRSLTTSHKFGQFVIQTFAAGVGAVPALGMQRIPDQLAANLPAGVLHLNTPAEAITPGHGHARRRRPGRVPGGGGGDRRHDGPPG